MTVQLFGETPVIVNHRKAEGKRDSNEMRKYVLRVSVTPHLHQDSCSFFLLFCLFHFLSYHCLAKHQHSDVTFR